jgi:hypothetical protein
VESLDLEKTEEPMKICIALFCALAFAACGDDDDNGTNAVDAGGNTSDAGPEFDAQPETPTATIIAVSGDYAGNGVLTTISVPEMEVTVNAIAGVAGGDPVLRVHGDLLVILDRFGGDSVTVLDRDLSLVGQVSTGPGSNPQDSAVIGTTLYVAAFDAAGVLVFDLEDLGAGIQNTLDLASLDAADDQPDCNSLVAVGERLYVSCQILDRSTFAPRGDGKVAVLDTSDDSLEMVLNLTASNPTAQFAQTDSGDLIFSTAPGAIFGGTNDAGCVERISTGAAPALEGCLTSNMELNAYPRQVLPQGDSVLFVNVEGFTTADIQEVAGGVVSAVSLPGLGTNIGNITECPTGHLVVDDNTTDARGLRVYDEAGAAMNADPLDVGWSEFFSPSNSTICW